MSAAIEFPTVKAAGAPAVRAPDGSEVRVLAQLARGGMALFTLAPGAVSRAVVHRTVAELWYVVAGRGQMWRRLGAEESIVALQAGASLAIPTGARFQFRCDGDEALVAVGATMPPWPGADEADLVVGPWPV
jgi:mannose-6-phosphate isomerase-like protein (cupin superfamily)